MSDLTLGFWNKTEEKFDVFAKIRDPQQKEGSALAIYAPGTEQELGNILNVLQRKGLLKLEENHFVVTPEGERYRDALKRSLLGAPQMKDEQHDA